MKHESPPKQPGRGNYIFKYYARACVQRYFQFDVGRESAALAYYLLFSIFPLMIFFSILLGYAHLNQSPIIAGLYEILPVEAAGIIAEYLHHVSSMQFGPVLLSVLFCCLWFPMRATNSLLTAMRKGIGRKPISHGFLRTQLRLLLYAVFLMVAILFGVLFMVLSNSVLELLSELFALSDVFVYIWRRFRLLFLAVLMFLVLYVFYLSGCEDRHPPFYQICPGIFRRFCRLDDPVQIFFPIWLGAFLYTRWCMAPSAPSLC